MKKTLYMTAVTALLLSHHAVASETGDTPCATVLASAPEQLIFTSEIYSFLRELDKAQCPRLAASEFDKIVTTRTLNLVSYSLLEGRLVAPSESLAPQLVAQFVGSYETAQYEVDENAFLILSDLAFYPCDGDTICVKEKISGWVKGAHISASAACFLSGAEHCPAAENKGNEGFSLAELGNPDFLCARYLHCSKGVK